jgi:hypothetical protein
VFGRMPKPSDPKGFFFGSLKISGNLDYWFDYLLFIV